MKTVSENGSIKLKIEFIETSIREAEYKVKCLKDELKVLIAERKECKHEFDRPAIKGWEHEGLGPCKHCGIGELYAISQKIGIFK